VVVDKGSFLGSNSKSATNPRPTKEPMEIDPYVFRWTPCERPCWPCRRRDSSVAWCCRRRRPPPVPCAVLTVAQRHSIQALTSDAVWRWGRRANVTTPLRQRGRSKGPRPKDFVTCPPYIWYRSDGSDALPLGR